MTRTVTYNLEAQLVHDADGRWVSLPGFTYDTEAELRECYQRFFAKIEGESCSYRLVKITEDITWEVLGDPAHH